VLQIAAIPLVLWWFQGGVSAAVAVVAVVTTGMALAHATLAVRLLPALRHPRFARPLASVLLRYGGSTVLITLLSLVLFNMEKFVVSGLVSATALAYYAVAFQVTRMLAILPGAIGQALLPAFARLQVDADRRPLQHLFDRSLRWLLLVNLPAAAILIALGRPILAAWLDPDFAAHAAVPLAILAAGSVINALVYVPLMLLQGVGRLDFIVRYSALMLAPYAVAVFVLVHFLGINGAAYAWTARSIVECALMLHAARKAVGVSITEKRALAWSVAPALLVVVLLLAAAPSLSATITGLAAGALAACLVYFLVSWTWILTSEEREWLTRTVGAFARRATAAAA
jgi:O-antigen/teichoic acid export membrane protein